MTLLRKSLHLLLLLAGLGTLAALVAANESQRKEILSLERQRDKLIRQANGLKTDFRKQLGALTQERDALHTNLQQLGKDLQALISRVEAAASAIPAPNITAVPTSRRSP